MVCNVTDDIRKAYVQRIVRESIKTIDKPAQPRPVTQDTILGTGGLGHSVNVQRRYHPEIARRLSVEGCKMKTLTPASFGDPKLVRVRDVTAMVQKDLG